MHPVQIILVPQGAEYQAVCQGLKQVSHPPVVLSLPVGSAPVRRRLEQLQQTGYFANQPRVLMMGLCGSLVPFLQAGDPVLYQTVLSRSSSLPPLPCDRALTNTLHQRLGEQVLLVTALTSDRVICTAAEKRVLSQEASVVDMEGYTALEFFHQTGTPIASLRVVSDDCHRDIPDLSAAFNAAGNLQPGKAAIAMFRQPLAAAHLIQGSLQGLQELKRLTAMLLTESPNP